MIYAMMTASVALNSVAVGLRTPLSPAATMPQLNLQKLANHDNLRLSKIIMAEPDDVCVDEECYVSAEEKQTSTNNYSEESRKFRRTVYMHDEWVKHRSTDRFARNVKDLFNSGVVRALYVELGVVTGAAIFVVVANMLLGGYTDLLGNQQPPVISGPLIPNDLSLPALPFSVAMPALSLLLVFRTNTAYFRWNEGRTLWGGLINTCRNVVRQANAYFPDTIEGNKLRYELAAQAVMFAKSLRCFLRGPSDEPVLLRELTESVGPKQAEACLRAANKPMFAASAMTQTIARAGLNPMDRARMDTSVQVLVDICGANERIFKSPIPLVYTRHTARFLTVFLSLLPLALWEPMKASWNHWATIPSTFFLALFLFGIEEIGIQIEEPFGILPLEALCNGAIEATINEMLACHENGDFYMTESADDFNPQGEMVAPDGSVAGKSWI